VSGAGSGEKTLVGGKLRTRRQAVIGEKGKSAADSRNAWEDDPNALEIERGKGDGRWVLTLMEVGRKGFQNRARLRYVQRVLEKKPEAE